MEKIGCLSVTDKIVARAAAILNNGGVLVFPTATVYGIGACVKYPKAVERIYRIKGRSEKKPLVLMLANKKQLDRIPIKINSKIKKIIKNIWPRPVTFIIKTTKKFARKFNSRNQTLALRLADHSITKKIIQRFGGYLATTSANFSGGRAAADFSEIPQKLLKMVDYAIDGGRTLYQQSSTIVDLTGEKPKIIRRGAAKLKI